MYHHTCAVTRLVVGVGSGLRVGVGVGVGAAGVGVGVGVAVAGVGVGDTTVASSVFGASVGVGEAAGPSLLSGDAGGLLGGGVIVGASDDANAVISSPNGASSVLLEACGRVVSTSCCTWDC